MATQRVESNTCPACGAAGDDRNRPAATCPQCAAYTAGEFAPGGHDVESAARAGLRRTEQMLFRILLAGIGLAAAGVGVFAVLTARITPWVTFVLLLLALGAIWRPFRRRA
jgi:hypothetical protein